MSEIAYTAAGNVKTVIVKFDASQWKPDGIRRKTVKVALCREDGGGFSILCLSLPGAGSQGETPEKAIENIREAIYGCVESYEGDGETVPWVMDHEIERPRGVEIIGLSVVLPPKPKAE